MRLNCKNLCSTNLQVGIWIFSRKMRGKEFPNAIGKGVLKMLIENREINLIIPVIRQPRYGRYDGSEAKTWNYESCVFRSLLILPVPAIGSDPM